MIMVKQKEVTDIGDQLKNMKAISDELGFRILGILIKQGPMSFSEIKTELKLNSNSLAKCLRSLMKNGLLENYYEKKEDKKIYSFYKATDKCLNTLHSNIGIPRIWELLKAFKNRCTSKGWKASSYEDWVEINDEYHNFLWARNISSSAFKRLNSSRKFVVQENLSYHIVDASYTAWLFSESPSENLTKTVFCNQDFSKRIALYDLSQIFLSEPNIKRFNRTESKVFQEFENFLKSQLKARVTDYLRIDESDQLCILEDRQDRNENKS